MFLKRKHLPPHLQSGQLLMDVNPTQAAFELVGVWKPLFGCPHLFPSDCTFSELL